MYLITNRALTNEKNLKAFGGNPNPKGPNELLMVNVEKLENGWKVEQIIDRLPVDEVMALKSKYMLDIDIEAPGMEVLKLPVKFLSKRALKRNRYYFLCMVITMMLPMF